MKIKITMSVEKELSDEELNKMYHGEVPSDQEEICTDFRDLIDTDSLHPEEILRNDDDCLRGSFDVEVCPSDYPKKTVTIPKDEYLSLKVADERCRRLENGGVDDWTYYGDSLNPDDEPSISEFEETEKERISKL